MVRLHCFGTFWWTKIFLDTLILQAICAAYPILTALWNFSDKEH
uniref:Uncharacterized protein n=1 Tax=Rhizophora mucronata TaxID=61149 RepID=A0A2P2II10_RHIMU